MEILVTKIYLEIITKMIELKDKLDWNLFETEFRTEAFKRRKEGESASDWLQRVSIKYSESLSNAIRRNKRKKYWFDTSFEICLLILKFINNDKNKRKELENEIGLDLSGKYDWRISELIKIEIVTGLKFL